MNASKLEGECMEDRRRPGEGRVAEWLTKVDRNKSGSNNVSVCKYIYHEGQYGDAKHSVES